MPLGHLCFPDVPILLIPEFPEKIHNIQSKLTSLQQASLQNKYVPCNTQNSLTA